VRLAQVRFCGSWGRETAPSYLTGEHGGLDARSADTLGNGLRWSHCSHASDD
jgi:hypothetical protein